MAAEAEGTGHVIGVDQPYIIVVSQSIILDSIISDISNNEFLTNIPQLHSEVSLRKKKKKIL